MKKAIRIIIPLMLTLAILVCTGWYLFIYDREFTRDMLLYSARYFDSTDNRALSTWFYNLAYRQADDNTSVAIELAEQHKSDGNYTKAEYVLSKAIADGGSLDLYIALSKTYVEQDKLLDAVNMLNNVSNPEIKQQLEKLRPSVPTCTPDPTTTGAYHTQYITVEISAESGTLYVNQDGEFPSVQKDLYQQGITLHDGENIIYAVTVADNGLVSQTSIFGFVIGGVITEVNFADPAIENTIRELLAVDADKVLFTNDLWGIKDFTVPAEAKKLDDLQYLPFLERLSIEKSVSGQLQHIANLSSLKELHISDTPVAADELAFIGNLPALQSLTLNNCGLSTIAGLENAVKLTYLDLGNNTLRNISPLSNMTKLQTLLLPHNALNSLSDLSSLSALSKLDVSFNNLIDLTPIFSLTGLKDLNGNNNSLIDISGIGQLSTLESLELSYNSLADLTPLAECSELFNLNVSNNTIVNISVLSNLVNLKYLDFSNNQVAELPQWSADCALVNIDGSYNLIETLEPLGGLKHLNNVLMDYNPEIDSVGALATCPVLIQVNVFGTKVKEVHSLTEQSIVVNFDPTL